jgi:type IV secretory pathway VirB2 component (pilin)
MNMLIGQRTMILCVVAVVCSGVLCLFDHLSGELYLAAIGAIFSVFTASKDRDKINKD